MSVMVSLPEMASKATRFFCSEVMDLAGVEEGEITAIVTSGFPTQI